MSFGKRGAGEGHPARSLLPPPPIEEAGAPVARMKVANAGGIDKGFIALAAGVVIVSAGAALAAPSVLDMFGSQQVRPIEIVVAGLDRNQAKVALAREAFPDGEGRAFMSALQTNFPTDHDRLLDVLADEAMNGGDRDALLQEVGRWSVEFVVPNLSAIGRSGADGFDELLNIGGDALAMVEKTAGCTADKLEAFVSNPTNLASAMSYGSDSYKFSMQTSAKLVNLAARGRGAPPVSAEFRREDEQAVMTAVMGLMMDEQIMGLMSANGRGNFEGNQQALRKIDICKMGRSIIYKLKRLPFGTKERMLAMSTQGLDKMPAGVMQQMMSGRGGSFPGMSGMSALPSGFPD